MDNTMETEERKKEGFLGQKMVVMPKNVRKDMQHNSITNLLYITDIGYYPQAKHHYRNRKYGTEEYILIYCTEGHGVITVKSKKHTIIPNSYFIIPAQTTHNYRSREKDPWSIYWLHFTGSSAKTLYEKYRLNNSSQEKGPSVVEIPFEKRRIDLFEGIITLLESGYSMEIIEYININLWQLLSSFIYHGFYSEIKYKNKDIDFVDVAIRFMKDNINNSITISELAGHLNYSASYLYSLFKEKTGYSPIQYFNHLKIQKACQYLSFTNKSIKEISFKLGFNDPLYFSRLFKKLMDLTPTDYRNKYKH